MQKEHAGIFAQNSQTEHANYQFDPNATILDTGQLCSLLSQEKNTHASRYIKWINITKHSKNFFLRKITPCSLKLSDCGDLIIVFNI